jgi:peptidyl-prolyl cis-trans isomerase B (cyclophilin B)
MSRPFALRIASVLACTALAASIAACSTSSTDPAKTGAAAPTGSASSAQPARQSAPSDPKQPALHVSKYPLKGDEKVVLKTSKGDITITLYAKDAPNTVATFLELVTSKFYDGTTFHRVEPGFVIQGGDPLTKDPKADPTLYGTGDPGFRLKAEFNSRKHDTGAVAMARAQDPDSAGSQFYITLAPQPMLDGQYTVFGQVTSGMNVVDKIAKGDKIESMTVEHGN